MYKPSYISGYKFGTGMKQQQKYPIKLHMTNKQLFFFFFFLKWNTSTQMHSLKSSRALSWL